MTLAHQALFMSRSYILNTVLVIFLTLYSLNSSADETDEEAKPKSAPLTINIDNEMVEMLDLTIQRLQMTSIRPEAETFAIRVNLSPLLKIRANYLATTAQLAIVHATLKQSQQTLQRLKQLNRDNVISPQKLLTQKHTLNLDQINYNVADQKKRNIQLYAKTNWGQALSHLFLPDVSTHTSFDMIDVLNKSLYLIYFPLEQPSIGKIFTHPFGIRKEAQAAHFFAHAPLQKSNQQIGLPYFYLSDQISETHSSRVTAWLPLTKNKISGFSVPASSIIWHLGQTYVYLKISDHLFKRVRIDKKQLINTTTYFIQEPLNEGDMLVIRGAQILLSEEFRDQIPQEDDDD